MEHNVYVSGSWKNRVAVRGLMNEIKNWNNEIAVDWTEHKGKGNIKDYSQEILEGLQACNCMIYCMDGIKSIGKNFELGYMAALGKPIGVYLLNNNCDNCCNIFGLNSDTISLEKMLEKECIFIQNKMYPILKTIDELKMWLSNIIKYHIVKENRFY